MKVYFVIDAGSSYVHTITGTFANVHDIVEILKLIRADDEVVYGDFCYARAIKRPEFQEDEHLSNIELRFNVRSSSIKIPDSYERINWNK